MKNYQQNALNLKEKDLKIKAPLVTEYMTRKLITFRRDTLIKDAIESLLKNRISGAPVLSDSGEVIGLIDDKDCLNVLLANAYYNNPISENTVSDFMSNVMKSISTEDNIVDVADIFIQTKYKRLLVLNSDGKLAGQISRRDILRAIKDINASTW